MDFTGPGSTIATVNVLRRVSAALVISAMLGTSVAVASPHSGPPKPYSKSKDKQDDSAKPKERMREYLDAVEERQDAIQQINRTFSRAVKAAQDAYKRARASAQTAEAKAAADTARKAAIAAATKARQKALAKLRPLPAKPQLPSPTPSPTQTG